MTTAIVVKAHAGWPVRVTHKWRDNPRADFVSIVEAGREVQYAVHDGLDLLIHEIQPDEEAVGSAPKTDAAA